MHARAYDFACLILLLCVSVAHVAEGRGEHLAVYKIERTGRASTLSGFKAFSDGLQIVAPRHPAPPRTVGPPRAVEPPRPRPALPVMQFRGENDAGFNEDYSDRYAGGKGGIEGSGGRQGGMRRLSRSLRQPRTPHPLMRSPNIRDDLIRALSPLLLTFIFSNIISAYVIPSPSMDGTLKVGDLVLAEKASSALQLPIERGDLVFFTPPAELKSIVAKSGTTVGSRDRFVKRVAAVAGDRVTLDESGQNILINGVPREPPPLACPSEQPSALAPHQTQQQEEKEPQQEQHEQQATATASASSLARTIGANADAEVLQQLQKLLTAGRISSDEAVALLREVAPPERESAESAVEAARRRGQARIFSLDVERRAVDPRFVGIPMTVPEGEVFVLGDCEARSTDSRLWGPLEVKRIGARPFIRIWPPDRLGDIETTVDLNPFRRALENGIDRALENGIDRLKGTAEQLYRNMDGALGNQ